MATVRALTGIALPQRVIPAGFRLDSSDPVVVANPQYFAPVEDAGSARVVEQATAAPGEVRNKPPAKKAPARKRPAKKSSGA